MVIEELVGTAEVKLPNPSFDAITNWHPIDTGGNLYCTFRRLQPTATGGRPSQALNCSPRRSTYKMLAGAPTISTETSSDAQKVSPPELSPLGSSTRRTSLSDVRAGWPVRVAVHAVKALKLAQTDLKTDREGEETFSLFVTAAAVSNGASGGKEKGGTTPEAACTESIAVEGATVTEDAYEWGHENGNELLVDMRSTGEGGAAESGAGQTHVLLEVWGSAESVEGIGEATDFLLGMVRGALPLALQLFLAIAHVSFVPCLSA
jgi:hypothetical protein